MSDSDNDDTTPLLNPVEHSQTHGTFSPSSPATEISRKIILIIGKFWGFDKILVPFQKMKINVSIHSIDKLTYRFQMPKLLTVNPFGPGSKGVQLE